MSAEEEQVTGGRYLRHSMIDWFDQEKVKGSRIAVIGAGATGNELLKNMTLLGIGHIHIVDFDTIEEHNLTRTVLFREKDTGRNKAEAAASACREIDPSVQVTHSAGDFWDSLSISELKGYDAIFCCADNFEARLRLNELCIWAGVDLYNLAIDSRFITVERYPFSLGIRCACYQCNLPESVYSRIKERYSCGWLRKRAWQEKKIPTTIVTSGIAGAYACSMFLQKDHPGSARGAVRCYIDSISLSSTISEIEHHDDCFCSMISAKHHYFKVRNKGPGELFEFPDIDGSMPIYLSDKIILNVTCRQCGDSRSINDRADRFDETLAFCDKCGSNTREVAIRDIMTLEELKSIFGISLLPVKYLYFHRGGEQFLLELEGIA